MRRSKVITAKVTTVGSSTGIVLPKEVLAKLRVGKGDELCFMETPEGFNLTPYDPAFAEIMDAAEEVMREDRDVLRALAK
jgi:putative addiction module antidote